jgi:hypothetical protein
MKKLITAISLIGFVFGQMGYTSFEEPSTGAKYYDTGDAATDHALVNNEGEAHVNYDPGNTGSELGFSSYYTNTLGGVGLTDGDWVGVTDFQAAAGVPYPDGDRGFQLSDCDGLMTVTLDTVDLSSATDPSVSCYYFIKEDGYESDDYIRIWVIVDGTEVDLLNTDGSDIDDLGIEGSWNYISQSLTGGSEAVFKFELQSNSGNEVLFMDFIAFADGTVNMPPSADAGVDQSVSLGAAVTLDGSGSTDSDGNISAYAWTQLTGVSVTLTNADQASSSFTAPVTEGDMSFELLVTDDGGESDRDTVNISVVDVGASAVFISEYVEGSSNNKYIEIYNGGDTAIDLNADGYTLARDNDGNMDFTYGVLSDWGSLSILNTGAVIVLAADGHEIYTSPDTVLEYPSPVHFNGNDAVALLRSGVVVDIVGELGNTADHIKDTTLTRNANITQGNSTFSWSEWTGSSTNNVSGLGQHNANVSAPAVAISNISPDFIADNVEIEISAQIVPVSGSISSAAIYYGTTNALINTATMSWDADSTWIGYITTGTEFGNELLQYKVIAIDNSGNQGESSVSSTLVASSTPDDIDEIHANVVEGQIVTIQGIITIGSGLLDTSKTKAYIQDDSDRGLNLFDYDLITGIDRGDELRVVGIVDQYFSTVEVTDFEFETVSTGNALPAPLETTSSGANSSDYEGTLISFPGEITVLETIGDDDGLKLTIDDVTTVMIWNSTGVTTSGLEVGTSWGFTGIGSQYSETYQLLVAYDEDIATLGIDAGNTLPNEFALYPAFPNPFNPKTTISFTTDIAGVVHVDIYDINGRKIDELTQEFFSPGSYSVAWNASSLASGIYFIRIRNNTNHAIQKVMLLK